MTHLLTKNIPENIPKKKEVPQRFEADEDFSEGKERESDAESVDEEFIECITMMDQLRQNISLKFQGKMLELGVKGTEKINKAKDTLQIATTAGLIHAVEGLQKIKGLSQVSVDWMKKHPKMSIIAGVVGVTGAFLLYRAMGADHNTARNDTAK